MLITADNNETKTAWTELLTELGQYCEADFIRDGDLIHLQSLYHLQYDHDRKRVSKVRVHVRNETHDENFEDIDGPQLVVHQDFIKTPEYIEALNARLWTLWNSFFFTFACITTIGKT